MNKNYKTPKEVLLETINHNKSPFKIPTPFAHVSQGAISYTNFK